MGDSIDVVLNCTKKLEELIMTLSGDEKTGAQIVLKSLSTPIKMIASNAGIDGGVIIDKIINSKEKNFGYNALTNEYVNMIDCGIIDPTKVTRCAIENAGSVASTLLTTEVIVCDKEDTNNSNNNPNAIPQGYGIY